MTLKEANYEVEKLNNKLNKLIKDKMILESITEPKSVDVSKIIVDGGNRENTIEIYVEKQDLERWKELDKKIQRTQEEINNYVNWIEIELKILKKYHKLEQLIVYYKEIDIKEYTWHEISAKVNYSMTQCRRIYKKYKQKRNI